MKLNKISFALAAGILWGLIIFGITCFRLLTGGTGEALQMIDAFYFGYSFSFVGSLIGFVWSLIYGFIAGWVFAFLYNIFAKSA